MSKLVFRLWNMFFLVACSWMMGCALNERINIEEVQYEGVKSPHLVFNMKYGSRNIDKFIFYNVEDKKDYTFYVGSREGDVLVVPIPAGSYYLRRLDMVFQNAQSVRFSRPDSLLVFKNNMIHYLGDVTWDDWKVQVDFSKNPLIKAMKDNQDLFEGRDVDVLNHLFGDPSVAYVKILPLGR